MTRTGILSANNRTILRHHPAMDIFFFTRKVLTEKRNTYLKKNDSYSKLLQKYNNSSSIVRLFYKIFKSEHYRICIEAEAAGNKVRSFSVLKISEKQDTPASPPASSREKSDGIFAKFKFRISPFRSGTNAGIEPEKKFYTMGELENILKPARTTQFEHAKNNLESDNNQLRAEAVISLRTTNWPEENNPTGTKSTLLCQQAAGTALEVAEKCTKAVDKEYFNETALEFLSIAGMRMETSGLPGLTGKDKAGIYNSPGDVWMRAGNFKEAAEHYTTALKLAGDNGNTVDGMLLERGDACTKARDFDNALRHYDTALATGELPEETRTRITIRKAGALHKKGIIITDRDKDETGRILSRASLLYGEAITDLEKSGNNSGETARINKKLVRLLGDREHLAGKYRHDDAIPLFKNAIRNFEKTGKEDSQIKLVSIQKKLFETQVRPFQQYIQDDRQPDALCALETACKDYDAYIDRLEKENADFAGRRKDFSGTDKDKKQFDKNIAYRDRQLLKAQEKLLNELGFSCSILTENKKSGVLTRINKMTIAYLEKYMKNMAKDDENGLNMFPGTALNNPPNISLKKNEYKKAASTLEKGISYFKKNIKNLEADDPWFTQKSLPDLRLTLADTCIKDKNPEMAISTLEEAFRDIGVFAKSLTGNDLSDAQHSPGKVPPRPDGSIAADRLPQSRFRHAARRHGRNYNEFFICLLKLPSYMREEAALTKRMRIP